MFKNLHDLLNNMPTEEDCRAYLEQQRWDGKPVCPHCGSERVYRVNTPRQPYKCANKECYRKFSVTVGTIFENSNVPLSKWFAAAFICMGHKKGISSYQLARDLGISQKSAWFMLHRIREMMKDNNVEMFDNTVEIDETYIGGKMKNKHYGIRKFNHENNISHSANKTGVMGILERESKVRLLIIDSGKKTLKQMVREHVKPSAEIVTDSANAYNGLSKEYKLHEIVNHIEEQFVKGKYHTNSVEGAFGLFKRGIIGIYHQVSVKHLERYCEEFSYRYNTRKMKDSERFTASLQNMQRRIDYKTLTGKK